MAVPSNNNAQVVNNGTKTNGLVNVLQLQSGTEPIVLLMPAPMEELGTKL